MKRLGQIRERWLSSGATLGNYQPGSFGTLSRRMLVGAIAIAVAVLAATSARASDSGEISELKAEIRAMNKRLSEMEEQKGKVRFGVLLVCLTVTVVVVVVVMFELLAWIIG